jgi:hypothetical protein
VLAGKDDITRSSRSGCGQRGWPQLGGGIAEGAGHRASSACAWACTGKSLAAMELFDQLGGRTMLRFSD